MSVDLLSPYSVFQLKYPQTPFMPAAEAPNPSNSTVPNQLRLSPKEGNLAVSLSHGLKTTIQEQILSSYTNSAALVTKAVFIKSGVFA